MTKSRVGLEHCALTRHWTAGISTETRHVEYVMELVTAVFFLGLLRPTLSSWVIWPKQSHQDDPIGLSWGGMDAKRSGQREPDSCHLRQPWWRLRWMSRSAMQMKCKFGESASLYANLVEPRGSLEF